MNAELSPGGPGSAYGPTRKTSSTWLRLQVLAGLALTGTACLALLLPLPTVWSSLCRGKLLDLGHVPLFAAVVVALYCSIGRLGLSIVTATAVAGLVEIVQAGVGRSTSLHDFGNGIVGTLLGAMWLIRTDHRNRWAPICRCTGTALLLVWPLLDAMPAIGHAIWAYRSFPTLCDFDSAFQTVPWECRQANLELVADRWAPRRAVGRLTLLPGNQPCSGALLHPEVRNWSRYSRMRIALETKERRVNLHVDVRCHVEDQQSLHSARWRLGPGTHELSLDFRGAGGSIESLELRHVESLVLWVSAPDRVQTVFLTRIYLE